VILLQIRMTTTPDRPPAVPDHLSAELIRLQWDAECQFNAALAQFQAAVQPVTELNLATIVDHARPAFDLGFCYLVRQDSDGVEVILRHAAGAEEISSADAATLCSPALLLAGLLGIPVATLGQAADLEQHAAAPEQVQSEPYAEDAPAAAEPGPDLMGPDSPPDRPGDHPSLAPLSQEQIDVALAAIRVMTVQQRKVFSVAFRNAFNIDDSVRSISPEITQLQHLHFIDRFSVEAAGGIAP
jgi:hypothetical protein